MLLQVPDKGLVQLIFVEEFPDKVLRWIGDLQHQVKKSLVGYSSVVFQNKNVIFGQVHYVASVSYTHLTLPTNREV